jgi:hypothetical protein
MPTAWVLIADALIFVAEPAGREVARAAAGKRADNIMCNCVKPSSMIKSV